MGRMFSEVTKHSNSPDKGNLRKHCSTLTFQLTEILKNRELLEDVLKKCSSLHCKLGSVKLPYMVPVWSYAELKSLHIALQAHRDMGGCFGCLLNIVTLLIKD